MFRKLTVISLVCFVMLASFVLFGCGEYSSEPPPNINMDVVSSEPDYFPSQGDEDFVPPIQASLTSANVRV